MQSFEELKTLSDKERLFIWLYFPYDVGEINKTIEDIVNLGKVYGIVDNVLLYKIIEYYHNKNLNKEQIIEKLYQHKFINVDTLHKVIEIIDKIILTPVNSLDDITLNKIIVIAKQYNSQITHDGYPTPDKVNGRPCLQWCECYYDGCHKLYDDPAGLRKHLETLGKHTWGFHCQHEKAIHNLQLTPEKVINNNMTKCPSITCDKSNYNFTPEELCHHFKLLGLKPFWKQGDLVLQPKRFITDDSFQKIYTSEECIICNNEDIRPSILFLPCNHCVTCINCYKEFNKCPVCRQNITTILLI